MNQQTHGKWDSFTAPLDTGISALSDIVQVFGGLRRSHPGHLHLVLTALSVMLQLSTTDWCPLRVWCHTNKLNYKFYFPCSHDHTDAYMHVCPCPLLLACICIMVHLISISEWIFPTHSANHLTVATHTLPHPFSFTTRQGVHVLQHIVYFLK